ncbi:DUF3592 domain-containing protein [Halomonas sp. ISL-60]|uniref:DUF3592 domain-containing protein n=1 Tax=Halomonas sp. ISL-56 TaxID=2819149 RepID=UPI001BE7CE3A|nr:DUF3592 domain-containing protein [Halomonas sp. ISL-60]MBT2802096.1 DUF3592 domain-containing protein [Halomonas sp. ISL-56]
MKALFFVKLTSLMVGIALLVGSVFMLLNTRDFLSEAVITQGTVVELVEYRSSDSITYRPVVQFTNESGQLVNFTSSTSSNPPSYTPGQQVDVLYQPGERSSPRINSFFSLWGAETILAGIGIVFLLAGVILMFVPEFRHRKGETLKKNGVPIDTDYQGVELNTRFSVNGRHPFQVVTQWQNPATSEVHVFKSNNIWFDPSNYIHTDTITVFYEKGDLQQYHVDLSFLPKLAK